MPSEPKAVTLFLQPQLASPLAIGGWIENIEDPLMREIRYLDKLIDELAWGKRMEKILRKG